MESKNEDAVLDALGKVSDVEIRAGMKSMHPNTAWAAVYRAIGAMRGLPADAVQDAEASHDDGGGPVRAEGYDEALVRGVRVDDGKYRFHMRQGDYRVHVERCGEPWIEIRTGCKAVLSMMMELDEARQKLAESRGQDCLGRLAALGEKIEGDADVLGLAREVVAAHNGNVKRIAELERECNAWRDSYGPLGPQTPEEVPVFLRVQARVDGQVAGLQIAKLRRAMGTAVTALEATRWQPAMGIETWGDSREGRNCERVKEALARLRGALGGSGSASEASELERNLHKGPPTSLEELPILFDGCEGISVQGGKYRFYMKENDWRIHVQREEQDWEVVEAGSRAVLALMIDLAKERKKVEALEGQLEEKMHLAMERSERD